MVPEERYVQLPLFSIEPNVAVVFLVKDIASIPHILMGLRVDENAHYRTTPPGGKRELGESIIECAIREVEEETTLEIVEESLLEAGPLVSADGYWLQPFYYFMESDCEPIKAEPEKTAYWYWLSVLELFNLVDTGAYPDVTSNANNWIIELAEGADIEGVGSGVVIPEEKSIFYNLFEGMVEIDENGDKIALFVEERSGTYLDWIH